MTPTEPPDTSLSTTLRTSWTHSDHIKRESRHIYNKLHSISHDAHFIHRIHTLFPDLLFTANLRCGAWYTDPTITSAVSYFKSTDGHTHQWSFSLKRSNLHLLPQIVGAGGAVIVDSTRRGKSMPDALSKTVPIWCAVLNRASGRKYGTPVKDEEEQLVTPEWMIPPTEHDQIEARINGFVSSLLDSDLPVPKLEKPLRPVFVTPQTDLFCLPDSLKDSSEREYTPIVLVSASKFVLDSADLSSASTNSETPQRKDEGYVYVQGAGDDHENWARGLTPDVFWKYQAQLLACEKDLLEAFVDKLVAEGGDNGDHWFTPLAVQSTAESGVGAKGDVEVGETGVYIASRGADHVFTTEERDGFDLIIHFISLSPPSTDSADLQEKLASLDLTSASQRARIYPIHMSPSKKGLSAIRTAYPPAVTLAHRILSTPSSPSEKRRKILVCCQDGKDLSGSLVVAILATCFTDQRKLIEQQLELEKHRDDISKDTTKRRLQWLVSANPRAAPNRAFLLRVNELLLSHRHRPTPPTA
ncbi:related to RIT1 - initiator tRNA phosphoribosyl-transferase [Ustilago trichophora]|uniref:Related to RIT1 - initiator tRNA phosphoribosyl-transferase n=1 Tax=Ustilago trichophora TaxID=86804 RepID=A0A5C3DXY6_9BASI|nr:related to RIT1 - initiator tRNA phosphoribosyl-transferase [Ustilago trichophora]